MSVILSYNNFYPKYINFLSSKDNSVIDGGIHLKICYTSPYIELTTVYIDTPIMLIPFGLCQYNNTYDEKNLNKYYLDFSFCGIEQNKELQIFYKKLEEFDNLVINYVYENKHLFENFIDFNKDIEKSYINQIRYNIDKINNRKNIAFPPTFKIKLSKNDDNAFGIQFFDINNNNCNINDFDLKGCKAKSVLECNGLWFANNRFGITWKLKRLNIEKMPNRINGYRFLD